MGEEEYVVMVSGGIVGTFSMLTYAMIFAKSIMEEFYNENHLRVTIEKIIHSAE